MFNLDQNIRPVTYSLPLADTLSEATPVGTTLFTLNVINPEADQTVTTMWNCNPSAGNAKFTLDGSRCFIFIHIYLLPVSGFGCIVLTSDRSKKRVDSHFYATQLLNDFTHTDRILITTTS